MIGFSKKGRRYRSNKFFAYFIVEIILLSSFSISMVSANPVPGYADFFSSMENGLNYPETLPLKHCSAEVKIDVYDELSYGHGKYILRNLGNTSINSAISFSTGCGGDPGYQPILNHPILGIWNNGTSLDFQFLYEVGIVFNLSFEPLSDIELQIEWVFRSSIEQEFPAFMNMVEQRRRFYFTSYQINGGKHWNNNSIDHETVQFCFHTDKFLIDDSQISVKYTDISLNREDYDGYLKWKKLAEDTEKLQLDIDSEGNKSFTFSYDNIIDDIVINIINDKSSLRITGFGYISLGFVGILGIGIIFAISQRKNPKPISNNSKKF